MVSPVKLSEVTRIAATAEVLKAVDDVTQQLNEQLAAAKSHPRQLSFARADLSALPATVDRFEVAIRVAQAFKNEKWEVGVVEIGGTEISFPFTTKTLEENNRGFGFFAKEVRIYEPVTNHYQSAPQSVTDRLER